jgi:hypothetical protein
MVHSQCIENNIVNFFDKTNFEYYMRLILTTRFHQLTKDEKNIGISCRTVLWPI